MDNELTGIILSFVGVFAFIVASFLRRILNNSSRIAPNPTYSASADRATLDHGIYTEHGMVHSGDANTIRPQQKRSNSFFESLI